jgi:hypothetical protein
MVFYFLVDLVTSISLNIIVKCSSWIVCQSANGVYYLYKTIKPDPIVETVPIVETASIIKLINNDDYIIITREEYNKLTVNQITNNK